MSRAAEQPDRSALWRFAPLIGFAALGVVFAWALFNKSDGALPSTRIAKPAPDFSLPVLDRSASPAADGLAEGVLSSADLAAPGVKLVNFWASWCAPCRLEHPQLIALAERPDVTLIGVAFQDAPKASRGFLQELGDPFDKVGVDADGQAGLKWGVEGVPESFLIDGQGRVILKHTGEISPEELETVILPAIRAASQG